MARDPLAVIDLRHTPQTEQALPNQVRNAAGGWVFTVSEWERARRFLTLGVAGGTYYASERELALDNTQFILDMARQSPRQLTELVVEISEAGRAPKNDPAIYALAACGALGPKPADRHHAMLQLPRVCRTGTHLFQFLTYSKMLRGFGPALQRAVARWYTDQDLDRVAYQVVKYRNRNGYTHRDALRLSHPTKQADPARAGLLQFAVTGASDRDAEHPLVKSFRKVQAADTPAKWVKQIRKNPALPWEALPSEALASAEVWDALIRAGLPQGTLLRQLPRLTQLGLLGPLTDTGAIVAAQLTDANRIRKARLHPIAVLIAARTYATGMSFRGKSEWVPEQHIANALDTAFYAAFGAVEPTGKKTMLAVDISGSMRAPIGDLPINAATAAAALALVTMSVEPNCAALGFASSTGHGTLSPHLTGLLPLPITPGRRLDDCIRDMSMIPMGGTDCSLPMRVARQNSLDVDTFVILTDNETHSGPEHAHQALRDYRAYCGHQVKLIVVGLTATECSIADPDDRDQLDVAGFDSIVPQMIADFSAGRL